MIIGTSPNGVFKVDLKTEEVEWLLEGNFFGIDYFVTKKKNHTEYLLCLAERLKKGINIVCFSIKKDITKYVSTTFVPEVEDVHQIKCKQKERIVFITDTKHNRVVNLDLKTNKKVIGNFHENDHPDAEEKRQTRRKLVDIQSCRQSGPDILQPVRQCKCGLQNRVGARFHHMIPADADGIVLGHVFGTESDDIGYDSHGGFRRIDEGFLGDILLQYVILDRPSKAGQGNTPLLRHREIEGPDCRSRTVYRHRSGYLVHGDPAEEYLHVLERVYCHS